MLFVLGVLLLVSSVYCDDRIINGEEVTSTSLAPWQVSLQQTGRHFCGGSIISANYILTACHCWQSVNVNVVMGTTDLSAPNIAIRGTDFLCHPKWNSVIIDWDFGLIPMKTPIPLQTGVLEAIQIAYQDYPEGTDAMITGWGDIEYEGRTPDKLQVAYTKLISKETCRQYWILVSDAMQCAGGMGVNNACNGDSGGPLVVYEGDVPYLVGNTSWGPTGCLLTYPAAWSKNLVARNWINSYIGE